MPAHRGRVLVREPVVEALVVTEVEALLHERELHVPVGLGDPGEVVADAGHHLRPVLRGGRLERPRAREDLVGHQHRHVAAHAVALLGDRAQRLARRRAQLGGERVELHDVGPGREVRVAPAGDAPRSRRGRSTRAADSEPRVVGRDVVGHEVEDQLQPARGERLARGGEIPEARVDDVVAHAVRRADHVLVAQVRQRRAHPVHQLRLGARDRQPGRRALPHAHQPDRVDVGHEAPVHVFEPPSAQEDRGVELVDPHPTIRRIVAIAPVQPVWWLAPSPAPLSPWKYSWKRIRSRQCGSVWKVSRPP